MVRRAVILVLTAALALTGLAGGASAATPSPAAATRVSAPSAAAIPQQDVVQQLADSLAEGLKLHGRKNLRKNKRLWQHGPSTGPGSSAHIVIRLKTGAVLGVNDVQFAEPAQAAHQFYLALPNARKLLKKRKHPVLVAEVTYYGPDGQVLVATQRTKI